MEGKQTKAASASRRTASWTISRVLCIILSIGMAGILVARFKPEADPARGKNRDGEVLRFDVPLPLGSLEPRPGEGGSAPFVFRFLYSYLFIMDEHGQLEPDLATQWSYDKESFIWTIQIRDGAVFHDGSPVTASDAAYSLRTDIEMAWPSQHQLLDRITPINEQVIAISLKKDDPAFLERIWPFPIFKQSKPDNINGRTYPIGSGPFKFEYRIENNEVGLTVNEQYYRGRPKIDKVVFHYQPDKEKSWTRLLAGKTDIVTGIEPQDYRIIEQYRDRFYFKTTVDPYLIGLLYNTHDSRLSDPGVRTALSCAIDKQYIVRVILNGMGVVPSGILGYYSSLHDPGRKPMEYDPARSLRLLRDAGWTYDPRGRCLQKDGNAFELTILFLEGNRLHESIARYVQLCFYELGIKVHLKPIPFDELIQRYYRSAEFEAVITELVDVRDGLNDALESRLLFLNRQSAGEEPFNPLMTAIAEQINQEPDRSRREDLLGELNSRLESLQPVTSLVQKTSLDVLSKRFTAPFDLSDMYYTFKLWQVSPVSK